MKKWMLIAAAMILLCGYGVFLHFCYDPMTAVPAPTEQTMPTETTQVTQPPETTLPPETTEMTLPPPETRPQPDPEYTLTARNAFVYDCNSGELRFVLGDLDAQVAPASLTKLFTAYVALQHLSVDAVIACGEETRWIDPESSVAWVGPGDQVPVSLLIQGMMMQSGNDAAYATAVAAGRVLSGDPDCGPKTALALFMEEVNTQAQTLGLTGTHFSTPDGLDAFDHYTTPRDLLTITLLALEHPLIRHYTGLAKTVVMYENGESHTYRSTNYLLHPESGYYSPDACGVKTGTTRKAGSCLMARFHNGEGYMLIGILGCPKYEDRFADALQLYALYGAPEME